jgi:hypothetical protein
MTLTSSPTLPERKKSTGRSASRENSPSVPGARNTASWLPHARRWDSMARRYSTVWKRAIRLAGRPQNVTFPRSITEPFEGRTTPTTPATVASS